MKFGIIADSHLGIEKDIRDEIILKLNEIKSYFRSQNIKKVIHLGDMIHESDNTEEDIEKVTNIFSDFDRYITLGNHDVINSSISSFEKFGWDTSSIIYKDEQEVTIQINSATESKYNNVGYIPQKEFSKIETNLKKGYDINIVSHYPIEKIDLKYDLFNAIPERAYPLNKDVLFLKYDHRTYSGSINKQLCGHLHPEETYVRNGKPTGIEINIFEPVTYLELTESGVEMDVNKDIDLENLVFEF